MKSEALWVKAGSLLVLTLLLLIPLMMINGLIDERSDYQKEVVNTLAASTSGPQRVMGPVLVIPYEESVSSTKDGKKTYEVQEHTLYILPEQLLMNGKLQVSVRKLGIYQGLLYEGQNQFNGEFVLPDLSSLSKPAITLKTPYIAVGISDPRGIRRVPQLRLAGQSVAFVAGAQLPDIKNGIRAPLANFKLTDLTRHSLSFAFQLDLQGTSSIEFVPLGKSSKLSLQSNWPHPNFTGDFLPVKHQIHEQGFRAEWESSWFANNIGELFSQPKENGNTGLPAFSTRLMQPVDQYQLNYRAVRYALLFIGLTFVSFFLFEILGHLRVHPIQYALVGMALVMFYLLLLALSEQLGFAWAYLIASSACVGQIGFYVSYSLRSVWRALGFASFLALLYGVLYGLLQLEEQALLLGAALLFTMLTVVMVATRKMDWYQFAHRGKQREPAAVKLDN